MSYQEADRLRTIGAGIALAGFVTVMVVFMAWSESGRWTEVLTWAMAGAVYLLLVGFTLASEGGRAASRYQDDETD